MQANQDAMKTRGSIWAYTIGDAAFGKATPKEKIYPKNYEYNDENCVLLAEMMQNWIT